ncbi:MAG: hypothetical protein IJR48_06480, partial [Oscillibacter sp.]|nr:hypothetical protein [Oscillibacter sp.]
MKTWKRGLASLLAAVMLLSMLPTSVFAAEEASAGESPALQEAVTGPAEVAVEEPDSAITTDTPAVEVPDGAITTDSPAVEEPAGEASLSSEVDIIGGQPRADDDAADAQAQSAYEVSYNLSGSGYWITVGSDAERAETDEQYMLFDEDGGYDIQLRENDDFQGGYRVEIRYRMRAGENWSVPQTVNFPAPNVERTIAGHTLRAQSKWLTRIRYTLNNSAWNYVEAGDYDKDGNYAMTFPDNGRFPLTAHFEYQTRSHAGDAYSGNWQPVRVTTPDEGPHDPVYQDMNDAYKILGSTFSLNGKTIGLVQYRQSTNGEWINIGPGQNKTVDGVLQEREFDANGNYTIDMGNRKDFPISVYFRALSTDGWHYLSGADTQNESVKRYANVFDTATIETLIATDAESEPTVERHVFSIHTTWMNDVQYAFFDETAFNQARNDYTITDDALTWTTIGNGPDAYAPFEEDGGYTVEISASRHYPFYLIFKSISPTGTWNSVAQWTTAEQRMSHLRNFQNVDSTADYEGHTFRLHTANLGDIRFTVRNSQQTVTHNLRMVQDRERLRENGGNNNYRVFNADNSYTIALTDEDTFPLVVTFNALDRNGWSDDILWEIPFRGWEQSQKIIRVLDTDYTFRLSIDFLGDTRYRWSDGASWNYVVPDPEARRYGDSVAHYPYDENGGYVIAVPNPRASDLFVADGNSYRLNRPLTIQYWDPESGWTSAQGTFTSLTDVHQITTADTQRHAFSLSSIYSDEVRYSFNDPETASNPGWVIVGHNEETANVLFDGNDYVIFFEEDAPQIPFPIPTYFEAYTTHGWDKPQVTLVGNRNPAQAGQGTFQKAGDVLSVANGTTTHRFTAYYPWANSVRYTLTDRITPYTVTIGPDREFAEQNENYQYANTNARIPIEMDEGDFFPLHVTFEAKDNRGNTTAIEVKDGAGRALRDEDDNPIYDVEFTKNDQSEVYQVGNYRFVAESNWMDTIRIYLPERTVSVGHGIGANNRPLSEDWLARHPNYQLFRDDNSYTIPVRQTDTFPLEVEFLERSVDNHTRPIRHTFQSATDTWTPPEGTFSESHTFNLQSDYTDSVRYILAYREELTDRSGVLLANQGYEARAMTVVGNAALGDNYEHFATFDENGNFQITLPKEGPYSALPVDVWFAIPDENGAYGIDTVYKKVTFNSKDDRVTVSRGEDGIGLAENENPPEGNTNPHTFSVYAEWMDEVHYTLPKVPDRDELPTPQEITVGPDAARAAQEAVSARDERRQPLYVTYDEDGNYLIELEDDAFFPYVVDVRYRLPTREAFVPTFDENGNLITAFNNEGQLKPAFANVKHV